MPRPELLGYIGEHGDDQVGWRGESKVGSGCVSSLDCCWQSVAYFDIGRKALKVT